MITKVSHVAYFVLNQQKDYDFYVTTLGFKVNTDVTMDNGFRWLTVSPPEQPDLEITLLAPLAGNMMGYDDETRNAFRILLEKGALGAGVLYTPDCRATYEELKAKGVQFKGEPKEQFYGIEAIISDGVGNWFSMTQPTDGPPAK
jgi:catechol 2,3-dioxygenase-like lactoylglutathione lyase family enzyme